MQQLIPYRLIVMTLVAVFTNGCASDSRQAPPAASPGVPVKAALPTLRGIVTFEDRGTLPSGSMLIIRLQDVATKPPAVVAETQLPLTGPMAPTSFTLPYDAARIQSAHGYQLVASVSLNQTERFVSRSAARVLNGQPASTINLQMVSAASSQAP